ncbi:MAG TPA: tetratricopeptide repeat protein [Thermoanaerobaculia bacterium]|nr:tetratricopeptide repeat protein [Thermoanaerobaculia bacterium]
MKRLIALALILGASSPAPALAQSQRLASDFEIAEMQKQIARSSDFLSQLAARLNLGDLYLSRSDIATAREEYGRALDLAHGERIRARKQSDMTGYATATAYAGLAEAKLRRGPEAFDLLEEAIRYTSDSAKTWNLYASAMSVLDRPQKAVSAARNAVAIAAAGAELLDLAIYRHALAGALLAAGEETEAKELLLRVLASLDSQAFDAIRRDVARNESFEIYSTAQGEAAAYLSLRNRAQLRLAHLLETAGEPAEALTVYRRVLDQRSDDPTALAALARLATGDEQGRWFAAAFDANPFSAGLIRAYLDYLESQPQRQREQGDGVGSAMRRALEQRHDGQNRAARASFETLLARYPGNATLQRMIDELEVHAAVPRFLDASSGTTIDPGAAGLRQLVSAVAADRLDPGQRTALDGTTFRGTARFDAAGTDRPGQTVLASGTIDGVPFRFALPTAFTGSFAANTPLRLTYRVLGVTEIDGADAILAEPLGVEVTR